MLRDGANTAASRVLLSDWPLIRPASEQSKSSLSLSLKSGAGPLLSPRLSLLG